MITSIFSNNNSFEIFGYQHIIAITVYAVAGIILIRWAKNMPEKKQIYIGNFIAYSLSITIIVWTILKIYDRGFDIKHDLPFHLCNFIALLLPIFSLTRKFLFYEILLFWILAGTVQAIVTPDIKNGFPHYHFLKYWYVHAGLVIFILYATIIYNMKPTGKSVLKSFIALQAYFLLMLLINNLTGANYFYVNGKPEGATALDYLGDWPYYLLTAELIILPYFFLIYFPFYLIEKKSKV